MAIWLLALVLMIIVGILLATDAIGAWVLLVISGIVVVVSLLEYRAKTNWANRNGENHDE